MKVLLDEGITHELRRELSEHEPVTVGYAGLSGHQNGELLNLATILGYQVFITADRGIEHQQHIPTLGLAIIILAIPNLRFETIQPLVRDILIVLESEPQPGTLTLIGTHRT